MGHLKVSWHQIVIEILWVSENFCLRQLRNEITNDKGSDKSSQKLIFISSNEFILFNLNTIDIIR